MRSVGGEFVRMFLLLCLGLWDGMGVGLVVERRGGVEERVGYGICCYFSFFVLLISFSPSPFVVPF